MVMVSAMTCGYVYMHAPLHKHGTTFFV